MARAGAQTVDRKELTTDCQRRTNVACPSIKHSCLRCSPDYVPIEQTQRLLHHKQPWGDCILLVNDIP